MSSAKFTSESELTMSVFRANASIDQTIHFAHTLWFGRGITPKGCYVVSFLKYRVIIEKCANFDDPTEVAF